MHAFLRHFTTSTTRITDSCVARFPPNTDFISLATTVKHIHFNGFTNYKDASKIQNEIVEEHLNFKIREKNSRAIAPIYPTILTFEFQSVYTGGKRERNSAKATTIPMNSSKTGITTLGIPYVQSDRGGQVTYHGPGQLVAYFIWDLKLWKNLTSRCFVNFIEQCSLQTIYKAGIQHVCTTENTGVWVKKSENTVEKISSIGLNLKRNVTSHGLSINLRPDLKYLNNPEFVMCGLDGYSQTSIINELGSSNLNIKDLANLLCDNVKGRMNNYMMNAGGNDLFNLKIDKIELQGVEDFTKSFVNK
jgi:lipoyl(octanoyl) transferase